VGELTPDMLEHHLAPASRTRWTYFLCRTPAMMNGVERSLLDFGIPGRQIIAERFKYD
jgi:ferredoxin-NADP reductase